MFAGSEPGWFNPASSGLSGANCSGIGESVNRTRLSGSGPAASFSRA